MTTLEEKLLTKEEKINLLDRIHKAKIETIIWVIGVGIVQLSLIFLTKIHS